MMEEECAPADMPPMSPQLEKRRANFTYSGCTWTVAKLLEIHQKFELPTLAKKNQNKRFIFDSILQSGKVERVSDNEFIYEWEELPDHLRKGPKWKVLVGTEVVLPEGFNACGAQEGFFAPTNQEQAIGQTKFSYLVDKPIKRPEFAAKAKSSKSTSSKGGRPSKASAPSEKGGPSHFVTNKFKDKDFATLRPKNFFDLQISPDFIKKNIINTTNARATA